MVFYGFLDTARNGNVAWRPPALHELATRRHRIPSVVGTATPRAERQRRTLIQHIASHGDFALRYENIIVIITLLIY